MRSPLTAPRPAACESLEERRLMAIALFSGSDDIDDGQTLAGVEHRAHLNFGVARLNDPSTAREILYTVQNVGDADVSITSINVPGGFSVPIKPAASDVIAPGDAVNFVVRLNINQLGLRQGNVVVHTTAGDEYAFQIRGEVRQLGVAGAFNLGTLGNVERDATLTFVSQSDFSGASILQPAVALYGFNLAATSDVTLVLIKHATGGQYPVTMKTFRDLNNDGILQVSEENAIFPAASVTSFTGQNADVAQGSLAAGNYLVKCYSFEGTDGPEEFGNPVPIGYGFEFTATPTGTAAIQVRHAGKPVVADDDATPRPADGTDFGAAAVGSLARRDFVIKNTGDAPLQLNPAAFLQANNGFAIDAGLPSTLNPGGTARLGIRLLTNTPGDRAATVVVPTNVPGVGQFTFAVRGTVTADAGRTPATPPTATLLTAPKITNAGGNKYNFTVRYTGTTKIDLATLSKKDVAITGPENFSANASKVVNVTAAKKGKRVDVTYRVTPPGGSWNRPDNGAYSVRVKANQVATTDGATAAAATLGTFNVKIPKTTTPSLVTLPRPTFSTTAVPVGQNDELW